MTNKPPFDREQLAPLKAPWQPHPEYVMSDEKRQELVAAARAQGRRAQQLALFVMLAMAALLVFYWHERRAQTAEDAAMATELHRLEKEVSEARYALDYVEGFKAGGGDYPVNARCVAALRKLPDVQRDLRALRSRLEGDNGEETDEAP